MHRLREMLPLAAGTLGFVLAAQAFAQVHRPESVGMSSDRLERVAELMQHHIDAQTFSGAVTLIARDDQIVWFRAQGVADIDSRREMQRDSVFRIMSMTKPIVAFSILLLVEEGKVRLTDPASRFIPALHGLSVARAAAPARDITILDLLTHTSGLMSGGASSDAGVSVEPGESLADVLPRLKAAPLDFEPGTRWAYSAAFGFDVLAHVVEIAAGMPFDEFVQARIFGPLGMEDTFFYPAEGHRRLTTLYRSTSDGLEHVANPAFVNGEYFSGGGGLFSTAEDYLQFALMLLHRGELGDVRLLGRRTAEMMSSVFVPATLPGRTAGEGYGLGVRVVTDPAARRTLLSEGTFGWSGAFNTHFFIDPKERLVAIFMTQSAFLESRQQIREDFETAVMQALID